MKPRIPTWCLALHTIFVLVFCYSGRSFNIKPCPYVGETEKRYYYLAAKYEAITGINRSILLAHIKIETDDGRKPIFVLEKGRWIDSKNLFAIKAFSWTGRRGRNWTREYIKGEWSLRVQEWRVYDTEEESFRDYLRVVSNPSNRWAKAWRYRNDPDRYFRELVKKGWATDPRFAEICARRARTLR